MTPCTLFLTLRLFASFARDSTFPSLSLNPPTPSSPRRLAPHLTSPSPPFPSTLPRQSQGNARLRRAHSSYFCGVDEIFSERCVCVCVCVWQQRRWRWSSAAPTSTQPHQHNPAAV